MKTATAVTLFAGVAVLFAQGTSVAAQTHETRRAEQGVCGAYFCRRDLYDLPHAEHQARQQGQHQQDHRELREAGEQGNDQ